MKTPDPKEGELMPGPEGKPATFDRDLHGNPGPFVKRYNAAKVAWELVPLVDIPEGKRQTAQPQVGAADSWDEIYRNAYERDRRRL